MSKEASNKALVILQTSLLVSFICSISVGSYYTFFHHQTWSEFFYAFYIILVNKMIFPIGISTIVYCLIIKSYKSPDFLRLLKLASLLSIVSLAVLFAWNSLEVCLHYHSCIRRGVFYQNIEQQFLLGLFLCLPVSLLIISFFPVLSRKKS